MRKLILFMHVSLDGFVGGPNGEMNWIHVDDEIFDYGGQWIEKTDTALYGRVTYNMMEGYWPTAADNPNASKHDIEHSRWYASAKKIVLSKTLSDEGLNNVIVISDDIAAKVQKIKDEPGTDILIFGSPSAGHSLMELGLVDGYWMNLNPVLIGEGIPMFKNIKHKENLSLVDSKLFKSGVMALHYERIAQE